MRAQQKNGFTILEVLIVAVMGAVLIASVAELFRYQLSIKQRAKPKGVLVDLMTEVSLEVSAKTTSQLPPLGRCYFRTYSKSGELRSNDTGAAGAGFDVLSDVKCTNVYPAAKDEFKIVIRSKDAEAGGQVTMTFTPSAFLKLPTINRAGFVAIEVEGGFTGDTVQNEFPYKLSFVTFKDRQ